MKTHVVATTFLAFLAANGVDATEVRRARAHKRQVNTAAVIPATSIPPLASISLGMPVQSTLPATATYAAGATAPVSGAPHLPTPCG